MNELIQITTGGQGLPVVSARELYEFLGFDASQWRRWSTKNIVHNPYAEQGIDWQVFDTMSKSPDGGRPSIDYSLSLDFAKRLSMLARTKKGEQIRRYFLDLESAERRTAQSLTQAGVASRLASLEKQVASLLEREAFRLQIDPVVHSAPMAIETTRAKVARLVSQYAEWTNTAFYVVWNQVYSSLHLHYGFNVRAQRKSNYENLLDVAERCGQMERLHAILTTEFVVDKER